MAIFSSYQNFFGTYLGHYDGRNARLVIGDAKADSEWPQFRIEFIELDRNQVFIGTHTEKGKVGHIIHDITLKKRGGNGTVTWRELFLHTGDTNYISGISIWNGIEFGMCFSRIQ